MVETTSLTKVYIRVRPPRSNNPWNKECLNCYTDKSLCVTSGGIDRIFTVDKVFPSTSTQEQIYNTVISPLVKRCVIKMEYGAIIAYGQTGSGKTYTIQGNTCFETCEIKKDDGIIPRLGVEIFQLLRTETTRKYLTFSISVLEVYNETIYDLLSDSWQSPLKIRQDKNQGFYVENAHERHVETLDEFYQALMLAQIHRKTCATKLNLESSRSHALFCFKFKNQDIHSLESFASELYVVDLAGSENVSRSKTLGSALMESKMINKSLSALGNVIYALSVNGKKKKYIPFRDSKLTLLLQRVLCSGKNTCFICTMSAQQEDLTETLSTLRLAQRASLLPMCYVPPRIQSSSFSTLLKSTRQQNEWIQPITNTRKSSLPVLLSSQEMLENLSQTNDDDDEVSTSESWSSESLCEDSLLCLEDLQLSLNCIKNFKQKKTGCHMTNALYHIDQLNVLLHTLLETHEKILIRYRKLGKKWNQSKIKLSKCQKKLRYWKIKFQSRFSSIAN